MRSLKGGKEDRVVYSGKRDELRIMALRRDVETTSHDDRWAVYETPADSATSYIAQFHTMITHMHKSHIFKTRKRTEICMLVPLSTCHISAMDTSLRRQVGSGSPSNIQSR